jgi:hypothetical protein
MNVSTMVILFLLAGAYGFAAHIYYLFHRWACPVKWTLSEQMFGVLMAATWPLSFPFIAAFVVSHYDDEAVKRP